MDEIFLRMGSTNVVYKKSSSTVGISGQSLFPIARAGIAELSERISDFTLLQDASPTDNMDEALDALRNSGTIKIGTHVYYTSDDEVPFVPTGLLDLRFSDDASSSICQSLLDQHALRLVEVRGPREFIVSVTTASNNPMKVAHSLQSHAAVRLVEPDMASWVKPAFDLPNDTLLDSQWYLKNIGHHFGTDLFFLPGADARVIAAWAAAMTTGSPEIVLAIMDDAFDLEHPDLPGEAAVVSPFDFQRLNNRPLPDPNKAERHGTACAGVALARANGKGVVGVAPGCRLMPLRYVPGFSDDDIEGWFRFAASNGADVISCSWTPLAKNYPLSQRKYDAIAKAAVDGEERSRLRHLIFCRKRESRHRQPSETERQRICCPSICNCGFGFHEPRQKRRTIPISERMFRYARLQAGREVQGLLLAIYGAAMVMEIRTIRTNSAALRVAALLLQESRR
ncbi:MAG: S8 family serine peptidase [Nibricoccus sp.]